MAKKIKEPIFSDRGEPTWRLMHETESALLNGFIEGYKKDKYKARVLFFNNGGDSNKYTKTREVLFEYSNGDFKVCKFIRKYGISKTGVMYNHEILTCQLLYVKKKFYIKISNSFSVPTHSYLKYNPNHFSSETYKYLNSRFGWLRNFLEATQGYSISINTIITHKLFNDKKLLKYIFKAPWPVIDIILNSKSNFSSSTYFNDKVKVWKEMRQYIINVESLTPEMYNSPYFNDSCKMAKTLNKKVNCSWSLRRLKEEHDSWAREISNIVLETQPLTYLKIKQIYLDFAEHSGYEILKTNHDLVSEGIKQHHCVGTYIHNVDNGSCGIYRVGEYTMELTHGFNWQLGIPLSDIKEKTLYIRQIKGVCNSEAPKVLKLEVHNAINKFMNEVDMLSYDFVDDVVDIFSNDKKTSSLF